MANINKKGKLMNTIPKIVTIIQFHFIPSHSVPLRSIIFHSISFIHDIFVSVVSTYKEPFRGWIDNLYGPIGLVVAITMGLIHCILQDGEIALDMVPVDYTVNCLIACAWHSVNNK